MFREISDVLTENVEFPEIKILFPKITLIFPKKCVEYNIDVYKCCELRKRRCGICVHDMDFSMCSNAQKRGALWI